MVLSSPPKSPVLLAIVGPTASGKSSLAVAVALRISGEIVNCDSMQMVKHLDIGTAKPRAKERNLVPHHLFDLVEPDQYYSAGVYMEDARRVCRTISEKGKTPVVVGGTGLYLRALLEGVFEGPGRDEALRKRLRKIVNRKSSKTLFEILRRKDPEAASRIQPTDSIRIIRALEVKLLSGRPISSLQKEARGLGGFEVVKVGIGLAREILYDRINCRVLRMFEMGLIEEVKALLEAGYPRDCKGFDALGYHYAVQVIFGELSVDEAIELTQRDTRRYAKRQLTWFRKDQEVQWIETPGEDGASLQAVLERLCRRE
jgi:tRNA dimethylallyltransferase